MKLYISGPMAGYHNLNEATFRLVADELINRKYSVIVPHDIAPVFGTVTEVTTPGPNEYIKGDLIQMLRCDGVALLYNSMASWGAAIEVDLAHRVGLPVRLWDMWK